MLARQIKYFVQITNYVVTMLMELEQGNLAHFVGFKLPAE